MEIDEEDYIHEDKYWSQNRCFKRLNKYYERFHEIIIIIWQIVNLFKLWLLVRLLLLWVLANN